jgi:hypothetical protein
MTRELANPLALLNADRLRQFVRIPFADHCRVSSSSTTPGRDGMKPESYRPRAAGLRVWPYGLAGDCDARLVRARRLLTIERRQRTSAGRAFDFFSSLFAQKA